jgi:hypothetical protein
MQGQAHYSVLYFLVFLFLRIIRAASSQTIFFLWVSLELNIVSVLPFMGVYMSLFCVTVKCYRRPSLWSLLLKFLFAPSYRSHL